MATVAFDQFLPDIFLECPGVSEPAALSAVRGAAYDFCRKSFFWSEQLDFEQYQRGVAEYDLFAPTGTQVVGVISVVMDEEKTLRPVPLDLLDQTYPAWRTTEGDTVAFVCPAPSIVRFIPVPNRDGSFAVTAALAPTRFATNVAASVVDQHFDTIKYGALYRLKSLQGQTFSDYDAALFYRDRFVAGVTAATVERNRSNTRTTLRVRPRAFI